MKPSPGLRYLLESFPHFALPSGVVYLSLKILQQQTGLDIPFWFIIFLTLFAKPILFFPSKFFSKWRDQRATTANGAVMAPSVSESPLAVISKLVESIKNGYPGELDLLIYVGR